MDVYPDDAVSLPLPAAGQLFMPRTHRQALAELVRGILAGETFVALTGKPGVGKTTVLNAAIAVFGERKLRVRRIGNPTSTPLRLQQIMGELLGSPAGTATNEDIERLFDTLTFNNDQDQLVFVFDDAQYLHTDVLGYLQMVSSLDALGIRHQRVIFSARPEFWNLLEDPKLRGLAERIKVRPVIEGFCEAEARDYLCYRIGQMSGAIGQLVPDAALNAIIHHGGGIPGRLDLILTQSLVVTRGVDRELRPDTVNAVAQAVAKLGSSVVSQMVTSGTSGQVVEPLPSRTLPDAPERRHSVLHRAALICVAVLLVGGVGTAAWRSSVLSNAPEINRPTTTAPTLPREPQVRTAIRLIAGVTSDALISVAAPQHEGASIAGSLPTGSAMGADKSPKQGGVASPSFGSSPSPTSPVQWAWPQSSAEAPAASPQVPVSASSAATSGGPAQPSGASAALATAPSAPVPPASITAAAAPMPSPAPSVAPATAPKVSVSIPATSLTVGAAQPPKTPPSSAEMLSTTDLSPSPQAAEQSTPSQYVHATSAPGPHGPVLSAPTEATVPDKQRGVLPDLVAATPTAETKRSDIEATAPAAPVSRVLAIPSAPKTSAPASAAIPALAAPPSPRPQTSPADSKTVQIPPSLPPELVADLLRRGDAMLAIGDISAARLLYGRAADSGDARAATQLGKTYDPAFLSEIGAWAVPTDAMTAAKWYQKAMALGDAEATERLKRLREPGQ